VKNLVTPIRVLFVEDEFLIRMLMAEVLRDEGFEVIEAEDGSQAVAVIDGPDGFDLLLTDVHMPGPIDGIQVAARARQRDPRTLVIVVSARPDSAQRLDGLASRGVFVAKPYDLYALVQTIRHMLETRI
jgi:DNA-binding response OmpR family regulator